MGDNLKLFHHGRGVEKQCAYCGNPFRTKPSHYALKTYCSKACMGEHYKVRLLGRFNPNWRDADSSNSRKCETCGDVFVARTNQSRFCSWSCSGKRPEMIARLTRIRPATVSRNFKRQRRLKVCRKCGSEFDWPHGKKRLCNECAVARKLASNMARAGICVECHKEFHRKYNNKCKTCCLHCRSALSARLQAAEKSHLWRGGKTSAAMQIRNSLEYSIWRKGVFARDDYTCRMCCIRGDRLAAHHIKPFSSNPELRTDLGNGVALCWPCHRKVKGRESEWESFFRAIQPSSTP